MKPKPDDNLLPPQQALALSAERRRCGSQLLHQQCWLWGCDVRRAEGNLLLQHGFERLRPPAGETGATQYSIVQPDGRVICLWGFGFYFGDALSGVYLNRFAFDPRRMSCRHTWEAPPLSSLPRLHNLALLQDALRWIADYEAWVLGSCGTAYRRLCLAGWDCTDPEAIPSRWQALASSLASTESQTIRTHRVARQNLSANGSRHSFQR